ncbi:MAG: hypothetical protein ACD_73C00731G0001, partial [uncultured bacterium]
MIPECKKIFLVDISSFVFRAYYGIRPLHHSSGQTTHAVFGVVSMMLRLIREKKPENLVIVFDSPKPSFRKEIFKEYKANREAPPEDLPAQFEFIKKFISLYPLPSFQVDGFEADDIIATVVHHCREVKDCEVVIVSADKDLMQLIGDQVSMYDSMKERLIDEAFVVERFGVGPALVGDVLALAGDASDNIPGVKGIGEKTAGKLVKQFGSVENIYDHLAEIPGKLGENLKNSREVAFLSKKLVTLKHDVPIEFNADEIHLREPAQAALNDFFREMEFKTFLVGDAALAEQAVPAQPKVESDPFKLVLSEDELNALLKRLDSVPGFSFDTETTGLNTWKDLLVGLSLGLNEKEAYYIPLEHSYLGCPVMLPRSKVIAALKPYFENINKFKWAQNAKFDMEVLKKEGIEVVGLAGDSLLASYMLNPEGAHNLDFLAKKYLGHQMITYESVVPKNETFSSVPVEKACEYAAEDAWAAFNLCKLLHEELKKEDLWHCYDHIELPLVPVLASMEEKGILIDQTLLRNLNDDFTTRLIQLEMEIQKDAGCEFNVSSPKQLATILFEKLGLPVQKKIKTGYSTDVEVLTTLAPLHPIAQKLLNHRSLAKLKSTYIDQLRSLVFA